MYKTCWNFYWGYLEYVDKFGENWHLYYTLVHGHCIFLRLYIFFKISFNNVFPLSMYILFIDFQFDILWFFVCLFNIFSYSTYLAVTGLNGGTQSFYFHCGMWNLWLQYVGSSSLTRDRTQALPALGTQSLSHRTTKEFMIAHVFWC